MVKLLASPPSLPRSSLPLSTIPRGWILFGCKKWAKLRLIEGMRDDSTRGEPSNQQTTLWRSTDRRTGTASFKLRTFLGHFRFDHPPAPSSLCSLDSLSTLKEGHSLDSRPLDSLLVLVKGEKIKPNDELPTRTFKATNSCNVLLLECLSDDSARPLRHVKANAYHYALKPTIYSLRII